MPRRKQMKKLDDMGYVRMGKKREHVIIWEQHFGSIPDGWVVHHIDEDRSNNKIENLQCMSKGAHQRLHKKRKPCSVCGKPSNARQLCIKHYTEWHRKTFGRGNAMPKHENRKIHMEKRDD